MKIINNSTLDGIYFAKSFVMLALLYNENGDPDAISEDPICIYMSHDDLDAILMAVISYIPPYCFDLYCLRELQETVSDLQTLPEPLLLRDIKLFVEHDIMDDTFILKEYDLPIPKITQIKVD